MFKKLFLAFITILIADQISAQEPTADSDAFYVNVFVSKDKTIYVETEKTSFQDIEEKVSQIIRNKPFRLDQTIIYRIFADENLQIGYISDINAEMLSAYSEKVNNQRFLLNTVKLNIDGQDWFQEIDMKNIKSIDRSQGRK